MNARILRRIKRRSRERGAALFVVVLLITMLLGIGVYAARSATLATSASGHGRQMIQTQYVAQYGLLAANMQIENGGFYTQALAAPNCVVSNQPNASPCYRMCAPELPLGIGGPLDLTHGAHPTPGIEGVYCVEYSDWDCSSSSVVGMAQNPGNQAPKWCSVTATAFAQARVKSLSQGQLDKASSATASVSSLRAYLANVPP